MKRSKRASDIRRAVITTKILPEVRAALEMAAAENGRTLSAEIEQRLLASLKPASDLRSIIREELAADRERQRTPLNGGHSMGAHWRDAPLDWAVIGPDGLEIKSRD